MRRCFPGVPLAVAARAAGVVAPIRAAAAAVLPPSAGVRALATTASFPLSRHQTIYTPPADVPTLPEASTRTGVVALKCGMISDWDQWGERHPLTVLKLEDVTVVQVKREGDRVALQVGAGDAPPRAVKKPQQGHFAKAGVPPKRVLAEFPVTPDAVLDVGSTITAAHFVPGQFVAITGVSQGKGFQGAMRRFGFRGQPASHGVSKTHRSLGSTGGCQDPGKVWKGKKMAGHMGAERKTVEGMQVYKIDVKRNLVYVRGSVPGTKGSYVRIRDCHKLIGRRRSKGCVLPPFPTAPDSVVESLTTTDWDAPTAPPCEWLKPAVDHDPFGVHDWEEGEA